MKLYRWIQLQIDLPGRPVMVVVWITILSVIAIIVLGMIQCMLWMGASYD